METVTDDLMGEPGEPSLVSAGFALCCKGYRVRKCKWLGCLYDHQASVPPRAGEVMDCHRPECGHPESFSITCLFVDVYHPLHNTTLNTFHSWQQMLDVRLLRSTGSSTFLHDQHFSFGTFRLEVTHNVPQALSKSWSGFVNHPNMLKYPNLFLVFRRKHMSIDSIELLPSRPFIRCINVPPNSSINKYFQEMSILHYS